MIGDILNDVEAGNRAGCRTILINNGNETVWKSGPFRRPGYIVSTLPDAATYILHEENIVYTSG
jgi:D-glycero-D-manno-heptose 1,7-bisphosphate phosphatase